MPQAMTTGSSDARATRGRAIVLLLVLVALAAGVLALRFYAPQHLPTLLRPPAGTAANMSTAGSAESNPPLYKWKDAQGQWHITDQPPKGLKYETVRVDPQTNVIPGFVPEETGTPAEDE